MGRFPLILIYVLAALIALAGLGAFIWLDQSRQAPSTEGSPGAVDRGYAAGYEEGFALYEANCMACHGAEGQGRRGYFPPLAGHVPDMLGRQEGRAYLIDVLLHGVSGETEVQGVAYDGYMPGMAGLSDEEIAEILNYLAHAWDNDQALPSGYKVFSAEEVAERRADDKAPRAVGRAQPR